MDGPIFLVVLSYSDYTFVPTPRTPKDIGHIFIVKIVTRESHNVLSICNIQKVITCSIYVIYHDLPKYMSKSVINISTVQKLGVYLVMYQFAMSYYIAVYVCYRYFFVVVCKVHRQLQIHTQCVKNELHIWRKVCMRQ